MVSWSLELVLENHIIGFIKHGIVLCNDCIEQNAVREGKTWRLSHSTGCVIEYGESHYSEIKEYEI